MFVFCFLEFDLEEMKWMIISLQFEIKTVSRLVSNCGRLRFILFLAKSNEIFDFEMQRSNSCQLKR